jgi:hypothetical protein
MARASSKTRKTDALTIQRARANRMRLVEQDKLAQDELEAIATWKIGGNKSRGSATAWGWGNALDVADPSLKILARFRY